MQPLKKGKPEDSKGRTIYDLHYDELNEDCPSEVSKSVFVSDHVVRDIGQKMSAQPPTPPLSHAHGFPMFVWASRCEAP